MYHHLKSMSKGQASVVADSLFVLEVCSSIAYGAVIYDSWSDYCEVPMRAYLFMFALLGWPFAAITRIVENRARSGVILITLYFKICISVMTPFLLAIAAYDVNRATVCPITCPQLWWTAFVSINVAWVGQTSLLGIAASMFVLEIVSPRDHKSDLD